MAFLDDVEIFLGREVTAFEAARIERLADVAYGLIEGGFSGFTLTPGTHTVDIDPGDPVYLWTPRYPVTAVDSIEFDGTVIDPTWYRWTEQGRIRFTASTAVNSFELDWPRFGSVITVTYQYGADPYPADVLFAAVVAVSGVLRGQANNPSGIQSETIDGYSVSYGDFAARQAAAGMTISMGLLSRWKRRQMSVPLVAG